MILLVEDEDIVRRVILNLLKKQGHEVLVARHAQEALTLAQANPSITLLITDLSLPDLNGVELSKKLLAQKPTMQVLYMSGNPRDVMQPGIVLEDEAYFIEKADIFKDLAPMVKKMLA